GRCGGDKRIAAADVGRNDDHVHVTVAICDKVWIQVCREMESQGSRRRRRCNRHYYYWAEIDLFRDPLESERPYSILERLFICSTQMAKPTCEQSVELHSSHEGMPSTILTFTLFPSMRSYIMTSLSLMNLLRIMGRLSSCASFSCAFSHTPKATIPSSRLPLLLSVMPSGPDSFLARKART